MLSIMLGCESLKAESTLDRVGLGFEAFLYPLCLLKCFFLAITSILFLEGIGFLRYTSLIPFGIILRHRIQLIPTNEGKISTVIYFH